MQIIIWWQTLNAGAFRGARAVVGVSSSFVVLSHRSRVSLALAPRSEMARRFDMMLRRLESLSRLAKEFLKAAERLLRQIMRTNNRHWKWFLTLEKSFCESLWVFRILKMLGINYDSRVYSLADDFISRLFQWNIHYHSTSIWSKISPGSVFYVIQKM